MTVDTKLWLEGRDLKVHSYQDCEDIVELNKALALQGKQRGDLRQTSSIPQVLLHQWLQAEWDRGNTALKWSDDEFWEIVYRKLRDPDFRYLRTDW